MLIFQLIALFFAELESNQVWLLQLSRAGFVLDTQALVLVLPSVFELSI